MKCFILSVAPMVISIAAAATPAAAASSLGNVKLTLDGGEIFRMTLISDTPKSTINAITAITNFSYEKMGVVENLTATLFPIGTDFNPSGPATDNSFLNATGSHPHLTAGGFAFSFDDPVVNYQVFYDGGAYKGCYIDNGQSECVGVTASVPEPASWAMLISGFAMVGVLARRLRAVRLESVPNAAN